MAEATGKRHQVIRTLASLAVVFLLIDRTESIDFPSAATRSAVVNVLQATGVQASDHGWFLRVSNLEVPWTRDCAGLNILALLMALAVWTNRSEPRLWRYALRVGGAVLAGFMANIFRIFSLIGYRWICWPDIESPQMHYFIGFLWLVPFLPLVVPRGGKTRPAYLLEALYLSVVLAILAPFVSSHGGNTVAVATLLVLAGSRFGVSRRAGFLLATAAWIAAGFFIGAAGMESLWTPWLLICPAFASRKLVGSLAGPVLLAGSIPLVAMQAGVSWVVIAAACWWGWDLFRKQEGPPDPASARSPGWIITGGLAVALLLPFLSSVVSVLRHEKITPPPGLMTQQLDDNGFRVRVVGHPPDVSVLWYGPYGDGRHHTLKVCMRFRGIFVQPVKGRPGIFSDGQEWMREYFIQEGRLLPEYRSYLLRTFLPYSSAGIHLIMTAPRSAIDIDTFAAEADRLAEQIHDLAVSNFAPHSKAATNRPPHTGSPL